MRLGVVSDLHLEFSPLDVQCHDIDVLVLAGDTHTRQGPIYMYVARLQARHPGLHVVLTPGNHEHYGRDMAQTAAQLAALRSPRCHVLLNSAARIGRVTFVGGTLWARIPPPDRAAVEAALPDFGRIPDLTCDAMEWEQDACLAAIRDAAEDARGEAGDGGEARGEAGPLVVVTHFPPTQRSVHPKYGPPTLPVNRYFSNDLEAEVDAVSPALWVHGHTHTSLDYTVGGTRVVCNPRGYARDAHTHPENPAFVNPLVVVIDEWQTSVTSDE